MADLGYVLYDTAVFDASGSVVHTLFTQGQGAVASKTKAITNMIGNGELPQDNRMEIRRIGVTLHDALVLADLEPVWDATYLEFFLNNQTMFIAPLRLLADMNAWGGQVTQTTAADEFLAGPVGMGYDLSLPIVIQGGGSFKVEVAQAAALTTTTNVLIGLHGILTRPNIS